MKRPENWVWPIGSGLVLALGLTACSAGKAETPAQAESRVVSGVAAGKDNIPVLKGHHWAGVNCVANPLAVRVGGTLYVARLKPEPGPRALPNADWAVAEGTDQSATLSDFDNPKLSNDGTHFIAQSAGETVALAQGIATTGPNRCPDTPVD